MYEVKFIHKEDPRDDIYYYHTIEDALNHFNLFLDDNSCLYKSISIMDVENQTILCFMNFKDDGSADRILSNGCYVRLNKDWCRPEERKYIYRVSNINEEMERCLITCYDPNLPLPSSENVDIYMIDVI